MKKLFLLAFTCSAAIQFCVGQQADLMLKKNEQGFYVDHKVTPKENFYSVGRLFNVSAKDIAAFNKLDMAKGLNLGQTIRIPLTATNFSQTVNEGAPVYYKSTEKETLSRISNNINKAPVENLKRWNNITDDNIKAGASVVVGFLVNTSGLPTVSLSNNNVIVETTTTPITKPVTKPVIEPKKEELVVTQQPTVPLGKLETKTVAADPGFFKSAFDEQEKMATSGRDEAVTAGIFKTTNGAKEAKYYLLIDGVQPGTLIKVINPDNNKAIYAKVLGQMSGIRQNEGLNIRISNAAAASLGITDVDKFIVKLNY